MGVFGPCVRRLVPGRSKFDPDLHHGFAPSVPAEAGPDYLARVQAECPVASGELLGSLRLEERDGKAWVSSDTLHGGIALEWGSCHQAPRRILTRAAAAATGRLAEQPVPEGLTPEQRMVERIRRERMAQRAAGQAEADRLREDFRRRLAARLRETVATAPAADREAIRAGLREAIASRFAPGRSDSLGEPSRFLRFLRRRRAS